MPKAKKAKRVVKSKPSEDKISEPILDKKIIHGYKKYKLELTPEKLNLYWQKRIEARVLEFKIVEEHYDEKYVNDETLKKLAMIILNSANKIHTLNLNFSKFHWITDVGLDFICKSIRKLTSLKNIHLHLQSPFQGMKITDIGISSLSRTLKTLSSLQTLEISLFGCPNVTNEGLSKLSKTLKSLSTLRNINLKQAEPEEQRQYDAQGPKMTNTGLLNLSKALKTHHSLKNLTLLLNGEFADTGMQSFCQTLAKTVSLEAINLELNKQIGTESLSQALKSLKKLKALRFNLNCAEKQKKSKEIKNSKDTVDPPGMHSLDQALETCTSLQTLDLNLSKSAEINLNKLTSLKTLHLHFHACEEMTDKQVSNLMQTLKSLPCLQNIRLDFRESSTFIGYGASCHLKTDKAYINLAQGLKSIKSLQDISVNIKCSKITEAGITKFFNILGELASLTKIILDFEGYEFSDSGFENLCQGIEKLTSLQSLILNFESCSSIKDAEVKHLGAALKNLTSLQNLALNFQWDGIRDEGMRQLSLGLKKLTSLQSLSLNVSHSGVGNKGMASLCRTLKTLTSLQKLDLDVYECECLEEEGFNTLVKTLKKLSSLKSISLELAFNRIYEEDIESFAESLSTLRNLERINFNFTVDQEILEEVQCDVRKTLKTLPNLKHLRMENYQ